MKKLASLRCLEVSIACIGEKRLAHLHDKGCTKVMLESAASCLKLWQILTCGSVTLSLVWGRSYSDICNALLCFGVCNTCWRAWYAHFASLFYIIILSLFIGIFHIMMQYLCYFISFCMFCNYWRCIHRSLKSAGKVPVKTSDVGSPKNSRKIQGTIFPEISHGVRRGRRGERQGGGGTPCRGPT